MDDISIHSASSESSTASNLTPDELRDFIFAKLLKVKPVTIHAKTPVQEDVRVIMREMDIIGQNPRQDLKVNNHWKEKAPKNIAERYILFEFEYYYTKII